MPLLVRKARRTSTRSASVVEPAALGEGRAVDVQLEADAPVDQRARR